MCYQLIEIYSACECLYYTHAIDRCAAHGQPQHGIQRKTIRVGYACNEHSRSGPVTGAPVGSASFEESGRPEPRRRNGHRLTTPGDGFKSEREGPAVMRQVTKPIVPNATDGDDSNRMPSGADGSDGSGGWDGESVISVASSATTIDGDTVGLLFTKLLYFGDLRFLWPQLIARSVTWKRSQRTIERLLRRYSDDLHELAMNEHANDSVTREERILRLRASRFVRRSRANIAQRLCEAHYDFSEQRPAETEHEKPGEQDDGCILFPEDSDSGPEDESPFIPEAAEAFLFRTEPILSLQDSVKALVKFRAPGTTGFGAGIWNRSKLWFENTFVLEGWRSAPRLENSTRLHWTCVCGKALYDDFVELRPGALAELHSMLQRYGKDTTVDNDMEIFDVENAPEQPKNWKQTISQAVSGWTQLLAAGKRGTNLPRYRQDKKKEVIPFGACSRTETDGGETHDFVLLCIPFMRVATKLYQPEICRINSDQEFIQLLRHYYAAKRGPSPWKWLRRVKSINFVKFELYRNHLTDIRLVPSLPPPEKIGTEYAFDNTTTTDPHQPHTGTLPPIGPNHLAHLFEHPDQADVVPTIWNRVPRKLRAELAVCPTRGTELGWGLQLAEGAEWFVFFVFGCVGFAACLVVAMAWTVARDDIQGGFSVGAFLLAFVVSCGGVGVTAVSE
ncbi:hypothetical protein B0I37DRAFT_146495 [Chaetomium sp. MPI-CAGE-AT-0009]|nr:hypothetical protein B0I37DRAFT_146495 [Chaetomium sp. MPI-CAGE-AT-0009]